MVSREKYPEEGELVVCSVTNVKNYGAFASLDEFSDVEGFIHIAEVATGWVKYVRNYVREGQKVVCKVLKTYPGKGTADLSLKQVNEHQRREKIREWKNETRARKLLEVVAEKTGKDVEWCSNTFEEDVVATYGSLYAAFEQSAIDRNSLKEDGFNGPWTEAFVEVAVDNIVPPFVQISGILKMTSPFPNGVEYIRKALISGEELKGDEDIISAEVKYLGAPRYAIKIVAEDYKAAEEELKRVADRVKKTLGSHGTLEFKRRE